MLSKIDLVLVFVVVERFYSRLHRLSHELSRDTLHWLTLLLLQLEGDWIDTLILRVFDQII